MVSTYHLVKLLQKFSARNSPLLKGKSGQYTATNKDLLPRFSDNISQKCRICLRQGDIPVFDNENDFITDLPLSLYIKIVCDIEISAYDTYPQRLCKSCHFTLFETIRLRETAKETQLTLEKLCSLRETDNKIQTKIKDSIELSGTAKKRTIKSKERGLIRTAPVKTKSKFKEINYVAKPIHTGQSKFDEIANNNLAKKPQSKLQIIIPVRVTAGKYSVKQEEINPIVNEVSQEAQTKTEVTCQISPLGQLKSENLNETQQAKDIYFIKKGKQIDAVNNLKLQQQQKNDKIDGISPNIQKLCTQRPFLTKTTIEKEKNDEECTRPDMEHLRMEEQPHLKEDINENQPDEEMDLGSDEEWYHDIVENEELLVHDERVKFKNTNSDNKHPKITNSFNTEIKNDQQIVDESDEEWFKEITKEVKLKDTIEKKERKHDSLDSESDEDFYFDSPRKILDTKKKVSENRKTKSLLKDKYLNKVFLMDNKPSFQCQICKKILKQSCWQHVLAHLPDYPPQYLCEVCGKTFHKRSAFYQHRFLHNDSLPFKCDLCPYRGRNKEHLKNHLKIHSQECPFLCDLCPRKFRSSQNLARHVRLHSDPKLKCKICNKLFRENFQLKKHVRYQHSTVQPVSCVICGNVYKRRKHLLEHEIKVHNRKKRNKNNAIYLRLDKAQES